MILVNGEMLESKLFPNKELLVDINFSLDQDATTVEFQYYDNNDLLELYFVLSHIKSMSQTEGRNIPIKLIIRYMPYSRMDRSQNGSCFTLRHSVSLIAHALPRGSVVYVIEPHSDVVVEEFKSQGVDVHTVFITPELCRNVLEDNPSISVICFPDKGACDRYSSVFSFDEDKKVIHCNKIRDFDTGEVLGLDLSTKDSLEGASVLIIDDLCSRGTTFFHAANVLKDAGAEAVYLCVAHLEESILDGMLCTLDSPVRQIYSSTSLWKDFSKFVSVGRVNYIPIEDLDTYKLVR